MPPSVITGILKNSLGCSSKSRVRSSLVVRSGIIPFSTGSPGNVPGRISPYKSNSGRLDLISSSGLAGGTLPELPNRPFKSTVTDSVSVSVRAPVQFINIFWASQPVYENVPSITWSSTSVPVKVYSI